MNGKKCCQILKEIRQRIADENEIAFVTSECRHKGDCLGTCPKCEAEVQYLERELAKRQALGKTVAVASLAIAVTAVGGCTGLPTVGSDGAETTESVDMEIKGDMPLPPGSSEIELDGEMLMPPDMTYEELMGDVAYLPPPAIETLYDASDAEILRLLTLCRRTDILTMWDANRRTSEDTYDIFAFYDTGEILTLTYDAYGYVSMVERGVVND